MALAGQDDEDMVRDVDEVIRDFSQDDKESSFDATGEYSDDNADEFVSPIDFSDENGRGRKKKIVAAVRSVIAGSVTGEEPPGFLTIPTNLPKEVLLSIR